MRAICSAVGKRQRDEEESTDQLTEIVVTYPVQVLVLVVDNNTKNNNGMINSGIKTESSQLPANL